MKLLLVVDPLETLQVSMDTSLVMAHEANRRGHDVFTVVANQVHRDKDGCYGTIYDFPYDSSVSQPVESFAANPQRKYFDDFDIVIMRKDPPVDEFYIGCLYAMEHTKATVLNSPKGLRLFNEKVSLLAWPDLAPATLLSAEIAEIARFVRSFEYGGVIKPINMYSGKGVVRAKADDPELETIISEATQNQSKFIIVQEYIPAVSEGDKRIFMIDGKVIGAMNRVPAKGEWLANIHMGASAEATDVTSRDMDIVNGITPMLRELDTPLACIDIIGGYLSEVNITSPSGIPQINAVTGDKHERYIIDYLEERHKN